MPVTMPDRIVFVANEPSTCSSMLFWPRGAARVRVLAAGAEASGG